MSNPAEFSPEAIVTAGWALRSTYSYDLATFVVLFYDFLLLFPDEVKFVWKKDKTPAALIFLFNRYSSLLMSIVAMNGYFNPAFTTVTQVCGHFVRFYGVQTIVSILTSEAMLGMRLYALTERNKYVSLLLSTIWLAQLGMLSFVMANGAPIIYPPSPVLRGCVLGAKPTVKYLIYLYVPPLVFFDACAFAILLWRIFLHLRTRKHGVINVLLRDGVIYFCVVFCSYLVLLITGLTLTPDLKAIQTNFAVNFSIVMVNRMFINVKKFYSANERRDESSTMSTMTRIGSWMRGVHVWPKAPVLPAYRNSHHNIIIPHIYKGYNEDELELMEITGSGLSGTP